MNGRQTARQVLGGMAGGALIGAGVAQMVGAPFGFSLAIAGVLLVAFVVMNAIALRH